MAGNDAVTSHTLAQSTMCSFGSFIRLPQKICCVNLLGITVTLGYLMQDINARYWHKVLSLPSSISRLVLSGKGTGCAVSALNPNLTILMANLQL
jgi:hypothetical protein